MRYLEYSDICEIVGKASRPPNMNPTSDSVGPYECPVCLEYKHGTMLLHSECFKAICAQHILILLDQGKDCPYCRMPLRESNWSSNNNILVIKPLPNDTYWMDRIKFECQDCGESLTSEPAKLHHQTCSNNSRHQPPAHIPPRGRDSIQRIEVVSNPYEQPRRSYNERLIVYNHNGRQLVTRFERMNRSILDLKRRIGAMVNVDPSTIRMYKFFHREVSDNLQVATIAPFHSACHLASFTSDLFPRLSTCTAHLVVEELGPHPQLEPEESWD